METKGAFPIDGRFDPNVAWKVLEARKAAKQKVFTGAYLINSAIHPDHPKYDLIGGNKAAIVAHTTLGETWANRKELRHKFKDTLEGAVKALRANHGWGPFMAYQVVVDLTYTDKWLGSAPDLNTFNSAGPGTTRGLSRVFYGARGEDVGIG
jgi:hypothetical protein